MQNIKILAIVLNWQQAETTLACVHALQKMKYPHLDILIIDNGSKDNSVERLQGIQSSNENFLALPDNLGFAGGCNIGIQEAMKDGYQYALLINNDAFATPDMLTNLLAETAPDIALLSPTIYYASDPNRIWFSNGRMNPYTLDLYDTGRNEKDKQRWCKTQDVDYLLGTCLLVHLKALKDVGFLDERFFMYFEDLDWSLRFKQNGYRLRIVEPASLFHAVATSSGGLDSPIRRYHLAKSGMIFWRRHARIGNPPAIFLFRLGSSAKMIVWLLAKRKMAVLKAYLRGLRDGWYASA